MILRISVIRVLQCIPLLFLLFFTIIASAKVPITIIKPYSVTNYNKELMSDIQSLQKNSDQISREIAASRLFLNKPYVLFPNGEGINARFDKGPLYRTDAFDCLTYVSMIIALTKANNLNDFIRLYKQLNYQNGQVSFITRNHFTSADYNKNNQKTGILSDYTQNITTRRGISAAKIATRQINKPKWFDTLSANRIKLFQYPGDQAATHMLRVLHSLSKQTVVKKIQIPYIPINRLYNKSGEANLYLFKQIPPGAIIEIVRPNDKMIYGSLNITHVGITIPSAKGMIFREASSIYQKVTDVPLIAYLRGYRSSYIIYGINIEVINRKAG